MGLGCDRRYRSTNKREGGEGKKKEQRAIDKGTGHTRTAVSRRYEGRVGEVGKENGGRGAAYLTTKPEILVISIDGYKKLLYSFTHHVSMFRVVSGRYLTVPARS